MKRFLCSVLLPLIDERPRLTEERLIKEGEQPEALYILISKYSKFRADYPTYPEEYRVERIQSYDFDGLGVKFVYTLTMSDKLGRQYKIKTVNAGWEPTVDPYVPLRDIILDNILTIRK